VLTPLKAWVRPDTFHAVLSERSVRWYNACLRITRDADLAADAPDSEYVQQALGRDLVTAMQRLTTMERQSFVLKHIEGWRLEEIAESLHTNANNTKQALFRAVRKLRVDLHVWRGES
jgi:RNA polymerase sigma-70 factor (ECF subfamily)